jgi:hypothetical protein
VRITTFMDPKDVPGLYACMDVFVAPYVRPATETFALANIEAMSMRVPFVHFMTGGIQVRMCSSAQCFVYGAVKGSVQVLSRCCVACRAGVCPPHGEQRRGSESHSVGARGRDAPSRTEFHTPRRAGSSRASASHGKLLARGRHHAQREHLAVRTGAQRVQLLRDVTWWRSTPPHALPAPR